MRDSTYPERWPRRPAAARSLRALVGLAPVLGGVGAAALMVRVLPAATGTAVLVSQWILVVAVSIAVAYAVDRGVRRVLPLAFLLDLSLLFPDRAPSRFGVALRAGGTRELSRLGQDAADAEEPAVAAERILALTSAISTHDRQTRGHSERVRAYAELIGEELDLNDRDLERLRWAALLHDVGKLAVPGELLKKGHDPDPEEWDLLHRHPEEGARLAAPLLPWLGEWGKAIEQHHERFDGHGYPAGLIGEEISLSARIVAVADAYETMVSPRPYKSAIPHPEARRELVRCAGSDFDPRIVRAFLNVSTKRLSAVTGPLVALLDLPLLRHLGHTAQVQAAGAATVVAVGTFATVGLASPPPGPLLDAPEVAPEDAVAEPMAPLTVGPAEDPSPTPTPSPSPTPATTSPSGVPSTGEPQVPSSGGTAEDTGTGTGGAEHLEPADTEVVTSDAGAADGDTSAPDGAVDDGSGNDARGRHPDTPDQASADPDPDTEPGEGASPEPRDG